MPGYDGTGPRGMGSMTGGGRGYCAVPEGSFAGRPRTGRVFGRGGGRGARNRFYAIGMPRWQRAVYGYPVYGEAHPYSSAPTVEEERDMLKGEAEALKQELENIQSCISTLEKDEEKKKN
ncbi:MAG: DUF5320 domain-containing protein [Candidatus Tantalella remota]|nr:DUF5320 domain-containing protein [Candidatus Tantalella remota]